MLEDKSNSSSVRSFAWLVANNWLNSNDLLQKKTSQVLSPLTCSLCKRSREIWTIYFWIVPIVVVWNKLSLPNWNCLGAFKTYPRLDVI